MLEYAPNGDLYDLMSQEGAITQESAQFYLSEIVSTLEYMHSRGIIHRDLKPENILLDESFHIKITDFGSAKISYDGYNPPMHSPANIPNHTFVGTADYVSPEILEDKEATHAVDIWALGCIVYQMFAKCTPFRTQTEYLTFQKITKAEITFPVVYTFNRDSQTWPKTCV